jgi:hypothetical protein
MFFIIFDWDDTLFPSSHLTKSMTKEEYETYFPVLGKHIEKLLNLAMMLGKTYIITNAQHRWVLQCVQKHLPHLQKLIEDVHIKSVPDLELASCSGIEYKKTIAFHKILSKDFNPYYDTHELISIGDSPFDRQASVSIMNTYTNIKVKNIKFIENPSIQSLVYQLDYLLGEIGNIVLSDIHVDIVFDYTTSNSSVSSSSKNENSSEEGISMITGESDESDKNILSLFS